MKLIRYQRGGWCPDTAGMLLDNWESKKPIPRWFIKGTYGEWKEVRSKGGLNVKDIVIYPHKKMEMINLFFVLFCSTFLFEEWRLPMDHLSNVMKTLCLRLQVQFSHSLMSDSLQPHGLWYARLPCPSPTPGVCSNSCPLSQWWHPTISSSVIPFSSFLLSIFSSIRVFSSKSVLHIR